MNFLSANSVLILFIYIFNLCNAYHYVVMKAESTASSNDFCAYSNIRPTLPEKITEAKPLEIVSAVDWCTNDSKSNASEQVLLIPAGNCSLDAQLQNFYDMGGKVILLINNGSLVHMNFIDDESLNGTGLSSMTISESSARVLKEMGEIITVKLFKPPSVPGVYFLLTIGAIAIFTAAVGSYVSGLTSYKIFSERVTNTSGAGNEVPEVHRLQDQRLQNRWFRLQQFLTGLLKKIEIGEENGTPVIVLNPCIQRTIEFIKTQFPQIKRVEYFTDGCSAQYKNFKSMMNLCHHKTDFQTDACWSFHATSHGKTICDGIGGTVKRAVTKKNLQSVYQSTQITNAHQMFLYCSDLCSKISFFFLSEQEIQNCRNKLEDPFSKGKSITGTRSFHFFFSPSSTSEITAKRTSLDPEIYIRWNFIKGAESSALIQCSKPSLHNYVACVYEKNWWIGLVSKLNKEGDYTITFMHPHRPSETFYWPERQDECPVPPVPS
ncbi:unnamed protein product [Larinioides sclopetarius]|uniref:Uncharacterized protein n=1 Tax=Larinioides sclopetarius TaxID=280406 RepID=A0AAV2B499_9ARAC